MSALYERPPSPSSGLRLHLNENTAGCSPRVLAAMRAVTREQAGFYPDYETAHERVARHFGVVSGEVLLTNGLDEGIHGAGYGWLQRGEAGGEREAVIVEPAFDMYAAATTAASGRAVRIAPRPGFDFPLEEVLGAMTPATRVVYLTSPNNPTGLSIPHEAIARIADALPREGVVFLDEAYVDFGGRTVLGTPAMRPNVMVGRTFAKAYGLAAVRLGAVIGSRTVIDRVREVTPPYSVNVFALAALAAALDDEEYVTWYGGEVRQSRELTYAFCERHGLEYWRSDANFVLFRVGPHAPALAADVAARGIHVRDRSSQPGCEGCLRLTTGIVAHTEAALAALEASW